MIFISVPWRLRLAAGLLLLASPLAGFQVTLSQRAHWWNLPLQDMGRMSLIAFLLVAPVILWLWNGRKWAHTIASIFALSWIVSSAWIAVEKHSPTLGFFTVLLILCFSAILLWIRSELDKSYLDPRIAWYQGLPCAIPDLRCEIGIPDSLAHTDDGESSVPRNFRWVRSSVGRLDREGAFVFCRNTGAEPKALPELKRSVQLDLVFSFRDRQLQCRAVPIRVLPGRTGAGLQFYKMTPDLKKELGDFVERLRGQGYVE